MTKALFSLKERLLFVILFPVIAIGILISVVCYVYLVPPLVQLLTQRIESELEYAADLGMGICEERLNYLFELRLENDSEVVAAYRREAMEEIKSIGKRFSGLKMLIVDESDRVIDASFEIQGENPTLSGLQKGNAEVVSRKLWGEPVRICSRYFPFWRWHIVSLITDKDYMAPVIQARRIVGVGTFGVLAIVLATVSLLFFWRVKRPLKKIIRASRQVARGNLETVPEIHKDEIGQVAMAFNAMVESLKNDKRSIRMILGQLRDSEEQYRVLTEFSLTNIVVVQEGRIVFANRKSIETFGYGRPYRGRVPWGDVHPDDRPWVREKIERLERGDRISDQFECRFVLADGRTLWFENMATLILYQENNAVLIHSLDRTRIKKEQKKRKLLEEKLARAQNMEAIGTLAGGVAHDLNNILGALVSYPDLLLMKVSPDSGMYKPLTTIRDSGQKAAAIVQDMLTLARRGMASFEVVNLDSIISDYLSSPEYLCAASQNPLVEFDIQLCAADANIMGSRFHISKAVMNLVLNAVESIEHGGKITIRTQKADLEKAYHGYEIVEPGTYVILSVADTGLGISEQDLRKIFEPFYTKKKMGRSGTGLGMAVVWGTVKDHQGFIDVSGQPGKGACFSIYFPVTQKEKNQVHPAARLDKLIGNENVLVVDDVEQQREIATRLLSYLGYRATALSSGEEAVNYVKKEKPDILVLDMIMEPGMSGLETYREILKIRPGQKAVIVSGFTENELVGQAKKLGAGQFIKKPYILETLGEAVRRELDKGKNAL